MKVLAIDTSSEVCSVALLENEIVIKELHNENKKEHSQTLMPMVDELMKSSGENLDNIDLLACGKGPGSFTGIRIGIATIKAFSDAKNLPMAGIDSLEALAYSVIMKKGKNNCKILSMIDARNGNVYFAVYRFKNDNLSIYKNAEIRSLSEIANYINLLEPLYIVGDVKPGVLDPLLKAIKSREEAEGRDVFKYEYVTDLPTMAEAIGVAATEKYNLGTIVDITSISPMYIRRPQAERKLNGENIQSNEGDDISILEMSVTDLEKIKSEYEKYPNIWDLRTLEEDFKNSKYIVAKRNNEVLGFLGYRIVMDELEIMNIVTRIDRRNQGTASNLLSYVVRQKDLDKINLEVNEHNITAINLYKKFGFRRVGLRKKYYNNTDDAILMSM